MTAGNWWQEIELADHESRADPACCHMLPKGGAALYAAYGLYKAIGRLLKKVWLQGARMTEE